MVDEFVAVPHEQLRLVRKAFAERVGEYPVLQRTEQVVSGLLRRNAPP